MLSMISIPFYLGLHATVNGAHRLFSFVIHSMVFPLIFLSFAPRPRTACEFVRVRLISFSVITLALCIPFSRPPLVYRYCIPVLCIIVSPTPTHTHRPPSPNHYFPIDALSLLRFLQVPVHCAVALLFLPADSPLWMCRTLSASAASPDW